MINLEFTEEEKNSLYYERFHHPHSRVQLKMEVLWLKSQKIPHQKICQLAGISPNTLLTYLRDDQEGGIEKLKEINFYRPKSELEPQRETLKKYFEKNPHIRPIVRGKAGNPVEFGAKLSASCYNG
jgi:hypothetical protein